MSADTFKAVEVFRAGAHTDSQGRAHVFTEADLDRIAAGYDPATHEAPAVIGHPKDNAPAYGWVSKVWREGPTLLADFKDVAPEFADLVAARRFKKRSISLYPDGTLRHVGFLGAVPPAVKGLKDVSFSDGDAATFEFEDYRVGYLADLLQRIRDWFIEKFGREEADKVVPLWTLEAAKEKPDATASFSEEDQMSGTPDIARQLKELEGRMASFSEQMTAKDKEIADLRKANETLTGRVSAQADAQALAAFASFAEGLVGSGRLTPALRDKALALVPVLSVAAPLEFAEEGKTRTVPAVDALKDFLEGLPVQVDFRERATRDNCSGLPQGVDDPREFAEAVRKVVAEREKAGTPVSFSEAAVIVEKNLSKAGAK